MAAVDLIALLPKPVAIAVASIVIGAGGVYGLETRYITASDFHKSYVLSLKSEIRALRKEIRDETDERMADRLREELAALIDELCLEAPQDRECKK